MGKPKSPRKIYFNAKVLKQIPVWVMEGKSDVWIAREIGCTLGTLVTTCSKFRIHLSRERMTAAMLLPPKAHHPLPLCRVTLGCWQAVAARARDLHLKPEAMVTLILEYAVKERLLDKIVAGCKENGSTQPHST